ncbi:LysM peptidoglycan-binding domain-containing protein [Oceanicola sp. D3]|uniref:LysM peptidoglycan-binding domain-containing protein n=1 Tax=Oceanicola sp. D3 TaxID=2587163 RepID=UPI00143DF9D8|nr:LysM peptidoglycan-binding domain-containing protein [Oceanicola sp. D3]
MSAWNSLSPVLRGGLTAGALALAGAGLWLWQGGVAPEAEPGAEVSSGEDASGAVEAEAGSTEEKGGTVAGSGAAEELQGAPEPRAADEPEQAAETPAPASPPDPAASDAMDEAQAAQSTPAGDAPPQGEARLPSFDLVRIEPGGAAVIAGNAAPGDAVWLLLDGAPIADATADASGAFVALTNIQPGDVPRVLTLLAKGEAGERRSEASVIVAPAVTVANADEQPSDAPLETASLGEDSAPASLAETPPAETEAQPSPPEAPTPPDMDDAPAIASAAASPAGEESEAAAEPSSEPGEADAPQAAEAAPEGPAEGPATPDAPATTAANPGNAPVTGPGEPATSPQLPSAETPETAAAEPLPATKTARAAAPAVSGEGAQLLVASGEGLRVLQPSATAAEVPLRVETIGYREGAVTLSGRGTGGPSDLRIYLDNDPVAVAPLDTDGTWTAELSGVTPGTYTLRVDQLAQNGKVTGRFETPFLRESEAALARNAPAPTDAEGLAVSVITVQPGYSLWAIASDRYGDGMDYHKVLEANRGQIRDPDLIYPGQIFDLPD